MDRQKIFNRVKDHLLAQNARSVDDGACRYRDSRGYKCAIGALINDDCYDIALEGHSPHYSKVCDALAASGVVLSDNEDVEFLHNLQEIHDINDPEYWPRVLRGFAERRDLVYTD